MAEILHQLTIKSAPNRVYKALTEQKGLSGWWTQYVMAEPRVDSIAEFEFEGGKVRFRMKIIKLLINRSIVWHCLSGLHEWVGTQLSFDLEPSGENTIVHFAHRGWRTSLGSFPSCNFDWARYLMSLRSYIEKGKGYPARK
jgi:uncharacterized protein YndB with AHSA1/START domain